MLQLSITVTDNSLISWVFISLRGLPYCRSVLNKLICFFTSWSVSCLFICFEMYRDRYWAFLSAVYPHPHQKPTITRTDQNQSQSQELELRQVLSLEWQNSNYLSYYLLPFTDYNSRKLRVRVRYWAQILRCTNIHTHIHITTPRIHSLLY